MWNMVSTKKKIRVLHVAECAGGVERYLSGLFKYTNSENIENIFICSQCYESDKFVGLVHKIEKIEIEHDIGLRDISTVIKIVKIINKYKPDIVYAHSSKAGAIVRIANIITRKKCIYNPHGWAFNMCASKKKKLLYKFVEKSLAPYCDRVVCISDAEKKSAIKNKIVKEKKLKVIYNGIDFEEYDNILNIITKESLGISEDAYVIGTVGRLTKQKSPDVFIKMAKLIKDKIPNAYFIMVGDGELKSDVIDYAKKNNILDSLYITGWVEKPLEYISLFDVAVLLSRWEGFGLVIPEYMLCGKPVIATEIDAIPNIIRDGENGLLVPPDNEEEASKAVYQVYCDNDLRKCLIMQAEKDVHIKYDIKRVASEHEELYYELI